MGSDAIMNVSVPAFSKEFGKKKRTNRLAKLKQCKLDARREQWLSQAKIKECKEESNGKCGSSSSPHITNERNRSLENLEMKSIGEEENEGSSLHDSDLESLVNSPTSSVLGGDNSRKDRPGSRSSSSSSNSSSCSSSSGCCSGSEEDDGCLEDWEAVADALTANDKSPAVPEATIGLVASLDLPNKASGVDISKPEWKNKIPRVPVNGRAWRPDDAFRPQSLPNLSKQRSFPMKSERHCGRGPVPWACHSINSQPSACPICYEDLDLTDSSFFPCLCGFRLCLFCHKRILEADGRCPGCRKQYDSVKGETAVNGGVMPFLLARSCSTSSKF
ncbi:hypothetical protein HHK36_015222 [Tetracentron sinense]|uniref:RING-type domain-containing protein n=1 Tax=Tetracentron sinense TaxID=13715 RepID=A0A834Z4Q1_TETSI|nr:hypothetical protein HHK36_015222 [Tetracentron sinense]